MVNQARSEAISKQKIIDLLQCRLEELEHTNTTDAKLVEEIHRRYKVQIEILNKEYEDQEKRFNLYIKEIQRGQAKAMSEQEQRLTIIIE